MKNLNEMTPEELFELNAPYLTKLYARQPLTEAEDVLYHAVIEEANRQLTALRQSELDERAVRFA